MTKKKDRTGRRIPLDYAKGVIESTRPGITVTKGKIETSFTAASFEGETIPDSIQAVQEKGLLQIPPYAVIRGATIYSETCRIKEINTIDEDLESVLGFTIPQHSLGERLDLNVNKSYKAISKGRWVVDVHGGGLIAPRPDYMRKNFHDRDKYTFPVRSDDINLLLGERHVYRWNGSILEKVPVTHFFTSFNEFEECSRTQEFQTALRDISAIYVILRKRKTAINADKAYDGRTGTISEYFFSSSETTIGTLLESQSLIMTAGGRENARRYLRVEGRMRNEKVSASDFCIDSLDYEKYDKHRESRGSICDIASRGISYYPFYYYGYSATGIDPEDLKTWRNTWRTIEKGIL